MDSSPSISYFDNVVIFGKDVESIPTPDLEFPSRSKQVRRANFINLHKFKFGMNIDIRYSTPLIVDEEVPEPGQEPVQAAISIKLGAGVANAKRERQDRQCLSFDWEYLEEMTRIPDKRWFHLPISWDSSAFLHDGFGTFIISNALLGMWPQNDVSADLALQYVEGNMAKFMGAKKFIWIDQKPEHTDHPLSSMVRFVRYGHVLISRPPTFNGSCPWVELYTIIYGALRSCKDFGGKPLFEITEIEEAHPFRMPTKTKKKKADRCGEAGWPLLSYLTYIHVKRGILYPIFGDNSADGAARKALKAAFGAKCPNVSGVRVSELPWWGSSLYSITQHIPLGPASKSIPRHAPVPVQRQSMPYSGDISHLEEHNGHANEATLSVSLHGESRGDETDSREDSGNGAKDEDIDDLVFDDMTIQMTFE